MRRPSIVTVVLVLAAGAVFFSVPALTQGPGRLRDGIENVNGREAVAREALVRLRSGPTAATLEELRGQTDGETIEAVGGAGVLRVRSRSRDVTTLVRLLAQRADVLYAEPNYVLRAFAAPNDPDFPVLWGLENIGQPVNGGAAGAAGADIRAAAAWDVSLGSTAHVVAVIDTGIDYSHPDLIPNLWTAPARFRVDLGGAHVTCEAGTHGFDVLTRTCNPMDDNRHGTHVAGTIGASGNDGVGIVGVNWTTRIMAIKFLDADGAGSVAGAIDGIRFAIAARRAFPGAADIRILSASWGGLEFSQALLDEIGAAQAENMLLVAAAGNYGISNDLLPTYPASYDLPNIVAVAATTNVDSRASFSNYGAASVHLGAPGVDIYSTVPGNGYSFLSGTSMAAPHVSGAAALVLSRCAFDTTALKDALIGTVQPVEALASTTITGGRLDVHSAVHACIAPPPPPAHLTALGGNRQVALAWTSALGATAYSVERSLTPGGPYTAIATSLKRARYTDADVVNGTTYYYVVSAANMLGESGASHEASATPNPPSDLVVAALSAPSAAAAGSPIAVSVTTRNQGSGPAPATQTSLFLSTNSVLDPGDTKFQPALAVGVLGPGASSTATLSVTIPADTPASFRYLIAVADAGRAAIETAESNNTRVVSIAIGPDLTVSVSAPSTAAAGGAIQVSDTVRNRGAAAAGASATSFYLSSNAILDASDTSLAGTRAVPPLEAGATSTGTATVTIPAHAAVGSYYLIARADGADAVAEGFENNNTSASTIRIGADLVVSAFSAPAAGGAGVSFSVTDTTSNQGTGGSVPAVTRFYLSTNASFDSSDAALGGRAVPALSPGAASSGTTLLTVPAATTAGSYYLLAVADADGIVSETLESNNRQARSFAVGADLRVSTLTLPSLAGPGTDIVVTDTTANAGGGAVGATATRYYFSSNSSLDGQDVILGRRAVPALAAGASHSGSATITIPPSVTAGTYYIIAAADGESAVTEARETNNTYSRSISVGGDLAIPAFSAPPRGGAGLTIVVTDTTANKGTADVAASTTRFYLSANAALDSSDTRLPEGRAVPALAAGGSSSGSTTLQLPSTAGVGTFYLFARADADAAVGETQENNNTALRSILIGPDLTVSALVVPPEAAAGSVVSVTDTTLNQGGGPGAASVTTFFLSTDAVPDGGDIALGSSRAVAPLGGGASSSGSTSLVIPAGITSGTYYVIARSDAEGGVAETSETNNARPQTMRIGPDLVVSAAGLSPTSIPAGSTGTVSDTVVNQGAGASAASTTRFYLSLNPTLDQTDVLLAGARLVPDLTPDAAHSGQTVITIPAETIPRSYYVLAKVDADGTLAESVETNNVRAVRLILVTAP